MRDVVQWLVRRGRTPAAAVLALGGASASLSQTVCETAHVAALDGGVFQSFGWAVDVSGDIALVGAIEDSENGNGAGAAYIFQFDGASWVQTQKLLASDSHIGDSFGFSVAIDGDTAMIGALQHLHVNSGNGSVYVFRRQGSTWIEEQELLASDGVDEDAFGRAVSISGDVAVIGASGNDDDGFASGSAYVFRYDSQASLWIEQQKLTASDAAEFDGFGFAVAISGDRAVIGSPGDDDNDINSGSAYVFRFDGSSWTQEQKLLASDGSFGDCFGQSVSISDDTALIGMSDDDGGTGAAYVFRYDPVFAEWFEQQKLVASDGVGSDRFGRSLSLDGSTAVIGALFSDDVGPSSGSAYVFRFIEGKGWVEQQKLLPEPGPSAAIFGWSVALSGDTAIAGAIGEQAQAGGAYLFAGLLGTDCNGTGRADTCDILFGPSEDANGNGIPDECEPLCPWDLDGSGDVGITDFLALLAAWGANPGHPADFDGDGTVGIIDFLELLGNWGPCA